jgi:hypothetical protein
MVIFPCFVVGFVVAGVFAGSFLRRVVLIFVGVLIMMAPGVRSSAVQTAAPAQRIR